MIMIMLMVMKQAQLDNGADMLRLKLALAQLYLYQEHIYQACDVLRSLGELSYSPGVVGFLICCLSSLHVLGPFLANMGLFCIQILRSQLDFVGCFDDNSCYCA